MAHRRFGCLCETRYEHQDLQECKTPSVRDQQASAPSGENTICQHCNLPERNDPALAIR